VTTPRKPGAVGWVDRDEVLARTDLALLADQLLGAGRGRGRGRTWRCPAPGHGHQTGRTPPVGVFTGRDGVQRWRCHGCGAGGTAVDLVIAVRGLEFRDALRLLAGHLPPVRAAEHGTVPASSPAAAGRPPPAPRAREAGRAHREELLRRTDLAGVATRLLGPPQAGGRGRAWPCPHPAHGAEPGPSLALLTGGTGAPR